MAIIEKYHLTTRISHLPFNFSKAIKDGTFSIDDINIVNGTIDSGSFTKVSEMRYTIMVESHPNGLNQHQNLYCQY
jgi:hypothetical protein